MCFLYINTDGFDFDMPSLNTVSADRWSRLVDICASLPEIWNVQQLLELAVGHVASFFDADCCVAFLAAEGRLTARAWSGLPTPLSPEAGERLSASLPYDGIRGWLEAIGSPVHCSRFLMAPMVVAGQSYGALAVCAPRDELPEYQEEDGQMLRVLAQRVGSAVADARLLEKSNSQCVALARIAASLAGEVDVDTIAQTAVELAVRELGAESASVWLAMPEEDTLRRTAGFNSSTTLDKDILSFDAPSIVALAASTRKMQVVESLEGIPPDRAAARKRFQDVGLEALVAAPLIARGQLLGVLDFARRTPTRWEQGQRTLIGLLADLLAAAFLKGRLFEESEKQRAEQVAARRELEMMTLQLKRANEQLTEANVRSMRMAKLAQDRATELQAILDNIVDVVFFCNPEEQISFMNAMGTTVMGEEDDVRRATSLENYLAAHNARYPDGQSVPREESVVRRALGGEVVRGMEQVVYDPRLGQDRYVLLTSAPVYDPRGRLLGAITVRHDITRLKELDLLKDKFMAVAAHEIKTPVTSIKGFAQSLLRSAEEFPARHRRSIEAIVRGSDRIDALIKEFLEVSTMRWGRMSPPRDRVDLTGLVGEVVGRQARLAPAAHRLITLKKDRAWVMADRDRLDQVLTNLLDNAVRYSPDGGTVEVSVARGEGSVTVSVKDDGMGIPLESQPHIFERFFRGHLGTPQDYGGLGVGLYISREIVRRMGGDMGFSSLPGEGSTFHFTLSLPA